MATAVTQKIPFFRVGCDGNELAYLREVLQSGWLTTADRAQQLERKFAEAVGARYACAVNSCTAALHLAVEALGVAAGQRVFVPTMTFTATAEVIRYLCAHPVFLDVEYGTNLVTPEILKIAISRYPDVKTLMVVHYGGQAAKMISERGESILGICRENGIRVVEDAAHAFPSRIHGRMVGSLGDATCFSFYVNKTITTGEGGMLTTDSEDLAKRVRVMLLHGIDRDIWSRFTSSKPTWEYDVIAPGYKYNMPDVNAAIGLAQLERASEFRRQRARCAEFYMKELACLDCVDLPKVQVPSEDHAWHLFSIVLKANARVTRNRCIELLSERGIGTSVHYKPLHRMTYYRKTYNLNVEDYPNAEQMWAGCLSLPIYPSLSDDDLQYVCRCLIDILE